MNEILLATNETSRVVQLDLSPRRVQFVAQSPELGESRAKLPARFLGGGDGTIHTGFNGKILREILQSLAGKHLVFDFGQNGCGADGKPFGKPAMIYPASDPSVRWVLMPINLGLEPTPANLGRTIPRKRQ